MQTVSSCLDCIQEALLAMQATFTEVVEDQAQTPAAVEVGVKEKLAELEHQAASVATKTSEARQKRRALLADITAFTRKEACLDCHTAAQLFSFSSC